MQQSYPGINPSISDWKGQEITNFQEELLQKVNAHISEKWFYNHIKAQNDSLPRIDILNLLSKYVGYTNWDDFVFKHPSKTTSEIKVSKGNRVFIIIPIIVILILALLFFLFKLFNQREYSFSFYDVHTREVIAGSKIEVQVLSEDESPKSYLSDAYGKIVLKTDQSVVRMVVNTAYYSRDTITRILKKFDSEQKIGLRANDYALIIHYFSVMNVDDWQKRRKYLGEIIDDGAIIYQVLNDKGETGMALYNKEEFIDKLTMPTGSLKHIEILDTKYKNERIMVLRFRTKKTN